MNINLDTIAEFTWFWNHHFFLETKEGNFIWSDPDYPGGNNTIRSYNGTLQDYCKESNIPYGRSKGKHSIRGYCGEGVRFI